MVWLRFFNNNKLCIQGIDLLVVLIVTRSLRSLVGLRFLVKLQYDMVLVSQDYYNHSHAGFGCIHDGEEDNGKWQRTSIPVLQTGLCYIGIQRLLRRCCCHS